MASSISLLGFASATQYSIIDAYRIESAPKYLQNAMSSFYIIVYRIGMVIAGASSLLIFSKLGGDTINYKVKAWHDNYMIMSCIQLTGILVFILWPEPKLQRNLITKANEKLKLLITFLFGILVFIFNL